MPPLQQVITDFSDELQDFDPQPWQESQPMARRSGRSCVRILLVEDDDNNRQLLADFLIHYGHNVHTLSHGRNLLATIEQFKPQIVLLDLKLPDLDGYTLLAQIQQDRRAQLIPVVIISAYAFGRDRLKALEMGARQYLVKPIRLKTLLDTIDAYCPHTCQN